MLAYLKYLLQLTLSPAHGWEDIDAASRPVDDILRRGYYPLIGLASASVFMKMIFHQAVDFLPTLLQMIITFLVLFVSYHFGNFALSVFLEPLLQGKFDERRCQTFTLYILGLVAVITIILNCLPVTSLMLFFMPLYVVLVEWKGVAYLHVRPDRVVPFVVLAVCGVLAPPYILSFLFSLFFE